MQLYDTESVFLILTCHGAFRERGEFASLKDETYHLLFVAGWPCNAGQVQVMLLQLRVNTRVMLFRANTVAGEYESNVILSKYSCEQIRK